jgi:hypothetical protein
MDGGVAGLVNECCATGRQASNKQAVEDGQCAVPSASQFRLVGPWLSTPFQQATFALGA